MNEEDMSKSKWLKESLKKLENELGGGHHHSMIFTNNGLIAAATYDYTDERHPQKGWPAVVSGYFAAGFASGKSAYDEVGKKSSKYEITIPFNGSTIHMSNIDNDYNLGIISDANIGLIKTTAKKYSSEIKDYL